ncbi:MAG: hypothetical protein LBL66_11440 [Clostridiales bacterium]|nr:hypothetical protein [Clostridiales bacterium]
MRSAQSTVHSPQSTVSVGEHCAGVPVFGRDCRGAHSWGRTKSKYQRAGPR